MRCRLGECVDCNITSAVASRAVSRCHRSRCPGVVHRSRGKRGVILVACIALRRAWNMRGWLAKRCRTIVTGRTPPGGRSVVSIGGGCPA